MNGCSITQKQAYELQNLQCAQAMTSDDKAGKFACVLIFINGESVIMYGNCGSSEFYSADIKTSSDSEFRPCTYQDVDRLKSLYKR